ncbi:MAG: monovalent cation:proton antiporter-2 (CPA2) family protein [Chromatiales bacterium]|jgi:CPA2 family monovalent cation:H+ antiporter-2
MEHEALNGILILLLLSVAALAVMRRINLPPILGYLLVGVLAGEHSLGWIPSGHTVDFLGELGVVFLLFMIGLEVSIPHLLSMRRVLLGLGGLQVVLSTLFTIFIARWFGLSWAASVAVGGALSLSSTAIVIKQLQEQLEMQSRHGRNALGILLFQDLAVVPFLVAIPILAGGGEAIGTAFSLAFLKAVLAFAIMFAAGHWLLRPLLRSVAAAYSVELFTLTILLVSLTAAWITQAMGLSLALGAFLAGVMLAETEFRHQVETEVRPFRDVLLGLFFVAVGTQLNPAAFLDQWFWAVLLTIGVVVGKGGLIAVLVRLSGQDIGVAVRTGAVLGQGGEFGFAILTLAVARGLVSPDQVQPILAAIVLSMAIAPLLVRYNGLLGKRFCRSYVEQRSAQEMALGEEAGHHRNHVIIAGFGRVGQNLAGFLREEGFDYLALDIDVSLISEAFEAGEPVWYGDSSHPEILELAGLQHASALVITFHDVALARRITREARRLHADIPIVVRILDDHYMDELEAAGATTVVPESLESSLNVATRTLEQLKVDHEEIQRLIEKSRTSHYRRLRGVFHGQDLQDLDEYVEERLHTVVLGDSDFAVGSNMQELALDKFDVVVEAVNRHGVRGEMPLASMQLQSGDALVLRGLAEHIELAQKRLLLG